MVRVLVITPNFETATRWGSHWVKNKAAKFLGEAGYDVCLLESDRATRFYFEREVLDAVYVTLIGHGNENVVTGQNYDVLLNTAWFPEDRPLVEAKHFHMLSCKVGAKLGKLLVEQGAIAFHGYDDTFYFLYNPDNYPDGRARPFFEADQTIDKCLAARKTHGQAVNETFKAWEKEIAKADPLTQMWLVWDRDHYVFYGNRNARLPKPEKPSEKKTYEMTASLRGSGYLMLKWWKFKFTPPFYFRGEIRGEVKEKDERGK